MVQLTEVLTLEHELIREVLTCLERTTDDCAAEGRLREQEAREAVDFFRVFVDQCHRRKEECCLFAVMAQHAFPPDHGPLGILVAEHEQARWHLRNMVQSIDAAVLGRPRAVRRFINHARSYVQLLRDHIRKEDEHLFPLADQYVTEADQRALSANLGQVSPGQCAAGNGRIHAHLPRCLADRNCALQEQGIPAELRGEFRC